VLCKAPYLNTGDSRVARRLEEGQWAWYYRTALRTVIQAAGRVVRAPDDRGVTYLADSSLLDLFDRARGDMPAWFADAVDQMSTPDLPPFDPAAALDGVDAAADPTGRTESGSASGSDPPSRSGRRSRSGATGASESGDDATGADDHPLSDVWGE
jgi:hypothetical protein